MKFKMGLENIVEDYINGLQIGGKNVSEGFKGVQLGGWNEVDQNYGHKSYGVQIGYLINGVNEMKGTQICVLFNACYKFDGLQLGLFNMIQDDGRGKGRCVQLGTLNVTDNMKGVQLGWGNISEKKMDGLQLGFFNEVEDGYCLQVGLWNRRRGDPWYKGIPFVRWNKNG